MLPSPPVADPRNATTLARDSVCFTSLGEDERATISYCIVSSPKPSLLQSMCSVCCTTSWICAATLITEFRGFATLFVSAKISP